MYISGCKPQLHESVLWNLIRFKVYFVINNMNFSEETWNISLIIDFVIWHYSYLNLCLHKAEKVHLCDHHRNHMHMGSWNLKPCEPKVWWHKVKWHSGEAPKLQALEESWPIGSWGSWWHAKETIPSMYGGPIWGDSTMCWVPHLLLVPQAHWKRWLETRFCSDSGAWRLSSELWLLLFQKICA